MGEDKIYDDRILEHVEDADKPEVQHMDVTLKTGVQLRLKPIPVLRAQAIINRFKYPPVPELWDDARGRNIRNPNSPEYVEQRQQVDIERTMAIIDAVIVTGAEVLNVPDSVPALEGDEWIDELEITHVLLPGWNRESVAARKLAWIKYVAIKDTEDMELVARAANLNMGTSEARVAQSLQDNFPDN